MNRQQVRQMRIQHIYNDHFQSIPVYSTAACDYPVVFFYGKAENYQLFSIPVYQNSSALNSLSGIPQGA